MSEALALARRAKIASVSPNPRVGAIIVKAGKVIAKGYHKSFGCEHAEINAINSVKDKKQLQCATIYVTLEPCSTQGKTPACTDAIIQHKIKRVVAATADPNPAHAGNGFKILERAGIKTECGLLEKEAREINQSFFKLHTTGLPFITLKMAVSLDGKIATHTGDSKWISAPESRKVVAQLRTEADAVMVGAQTVRKDDPVLLPETWEDSRQIYRVAIDPRLSIPAQAKIFKNGHGAKTILITNKTLRASAAKIKTLENKGVTILPALEKTKSGKSAKLTDAMRALGQKGISHILCEGGGTLAAALFEEKLIDHVVFFIAPKIIGGSAAPSAVGGSGAKLLYDCLNLKDTKTIKCGPDVMVQGRVVYPPKI